MWLTTHLVILLEYLVEPQHQIPYAEHLGCIVCPLPTYLVAATPPACSCRCSAREDIVPACQINP